LIYFDFVGGFSSHSHFLLFLGKLSLQNLTSQLYIPWDITFMAFAAAAAAAATVVVVIVVRAGCRLLSLRRLKSF